MKAILTICLLAITSSCVFGQETKTVVGLYQHKERLGPFFKRWYWDIIGLCPYAWKETLELKNDDTFVYNYFGCDCGTFNHSSTGTWTTKNNRLILRPDVEDAFYTHHLAYKVDGRKLYNTKDSLDTKTIAFKRKF